jgi:16S rRNA (cytosine967-C5)-methyltransferase
VSEPSDTPGLPARAAAAEILRAALLGRAGIEGALAHPSLRALEPRDRAFARALALATLRHLGPIDTALQARLKKPPPEGVVNLLRIGAAQLFVLKTPPHAAVDATVGLAPLVFRGLVNAVLRGLSREPPDLADPDRLAPPWLYARWRSAYGEAQAREIAATIPQEPPTDLTLKPGAEPEGLEGERLPGATFRTAMGGDVTGWPGFAEGAWWVQDASAAVPARLLDARPGQTVLDMCAAPGGKALQLAAAGAAVTALDRSGARLKRVTENLARTGLTAEIVEADAASWADTRTFDAVLLDAPCSATGTFRRHPDVLWVASPAEIPKLAAVQARLLDSAARRTAPGGRLVYCVCSLEPEEGEAQAQAFLTRHPEFALEPVAAGEGGAPGASLRPDGTLRILPQHRAGGTDGFYIARFRKAADHAKAKP